MLETPNASPPPSPTASVVGAHAASAMVMPATLTNRLIATFEARVPSICSHTVSATKDLSPRLGIIPKPLET